MGSLTALLRMPLGGLCLALAACTQTTAPVTPVTASEAREGSGVDQASFGAFTDVPIPEAAEMDLERTLLLGGRDAWIGRLVLTTSSSPSAIFDFYRGEMPKFGWSEITVVRAEVSILTYTRLDRVATVQIRPGRFRGSEVNVTVSPRGSQGSSPGTGSPP